MSDNFIDAVQQLIRDKAVPEIASQLSDLKSSVDAPWKRNLLGAAEILLREQGPSGLQLLRNAVDAVASGKAPDLHGLSMSAASDVLAALQEKESMQRKQTKDFLDKLETSLVKVASVVLTTVFKEVG